MRWGARPSARPWIRQWHRSFEKDHRRTFNDVSPGFQRHWHLTYWHFGSQCQSPAYFFKWSESNLYPQWSADYRTSRMNYPDRRYVIQLTLQDFTFKNIKESQICKMISASDGKSPVQPFCTFWSGRKFFKRFNSMYIMSVKYRHIVLLVARRVTLVERVYLFVPNFWGGGKELTSGTLSISQHRLSDGGTVRYLSAW